MSQTITFVSPQVSRKPKAAKYTYVGLRDLKPGSVVNVYGVVVFFKQPFRSRGTGLTRTVMIRKLVGQDWADGTEHTERCGAGFTSGHVT